MSLCKAVESNFRPEITILFLLVLLPSIGALFANSKDSSIRSLITQKESLSKRPVVDIIQDSLGYIWFASALDLSRFDGKDIRKYNNQASSSLSLNSDRIHSIHLRGKGDILIRYEDPVEFIDLLPLGKDQATKISLNEDNGIDGKRLQLFIDKKGNIFCLTRQGDALTIYQSKWNLKFEKLLQLDPFEESSPVDHFVRSKDGTFWLSQQNGTLHQFSMKGDLLNTYRISNAQNGSEIRQRQVDETILHEDRKGRIWYASQSQPGLYRYEVQKKRLVPFTKLSEHQYYTHIWEDLVGNIMIGTCHTYWEMDAMFLIQEEDSIQNYTELLQEYDKVNQVYGRDFSRVLFLGTFIGLKKITFKNPGIDNYLHQELEEGEWGWSIRGMVQTADGQIYIAREQDEWYRFDPHSKNLQRIPFQIDNAIDDQHLRNSFSLVYDERNNCIWGTRRNAKEKYFLLRFDLETQQFTNFSSPNFIQCLGQSKQNIVWVGCGKSNAEGAVYAYHIPTQQFQKFEDKAGNNPFKDTEVRYILESKNGLLWVGTKHGLFEIDQRWKQVKQYSNETSALSNDNIVCIVEQLNGNLLIGTEGGGLNIFNPADGTFRIYSSKDGLSSNYVSAIVPISEQQYWLSTYEGISYFDESSQSFRNFYVDEGLTYNEFNRFSFLKDDQGLIYFGGMNGFNILDTEELLYGKTAPSINLCLSKIARYNPFEDVLITNIEEFGNNKSVSISPYDSYFQVDFFLPDYRNPKKNNYRYQLVGYENSWNDLGNNNYIRYHDLPAGNYQLLIDAKPPGGQWGKHTERLNIKVQEFFYKTKTAFFFYALTLGLLFAGAYRLYTKRRLELAEADRLKELDEFKSRFYANISHEFRTPLTLISGPLDRAIQQLNASGRHDVLEDLQIAERNSEQLLYLINRILDLSKLEAGKLETNFIYGDLAIYFRNLIHSFKPLMVSRSIDLDFQIYMKDTKIDMDKQLLNHILMNLLANAIKFSPEKGKVSVRVEEKEAEWELCVMDEGRGIPADKLEAIFEQFHTTKAENALGTGIGLAFTKELVELLDGTIKVENRPGGGAMFIVNLPLTRSLAAFPKPKDKSSDDSVADAPLSELVSVGAAAGKDQRIIHQTPDPDLPLVLIVEDQYEVANFIVRCLASDYRTVKASNGLLGIEKAIELIPDVIISDVMMPKKNGFELCAFLKGDVRTSHIPIILLTAKAELEDRLEGLERGADDYLGKPFHARELKLRLNNLLALRDKLRNYYARHTVAQTETMVDPVVEVEREFVDKAREIVKEHLLDHNFDIPTFCKAMNMSRTQLHRKLTAITGHSASNFINLIRLEMAKELLLFSDQSISDVAYATGFSDPGYFSRTFSKFYDCNPSEFRKKNRK